jgi:hypothetical protein
VKFPLAVFGVVAFGWALLYSAEQRQPEAAEPEVVIVTVEVEPEPVDTPIADSLIDWDEVARQEDCLWRFMQDHNLELTFDMVWAASEVTDALGGACFVIGEDDD